MKAFLILFILIIAGSLFAAFPAQNLLGEWSGKATLLIDKNKSSVDIKILIHADGTVSGTVGLAKLKGVYDTNRGWLGRLLNIRSDYIIKSGQIIGKVYTDDVLISRQFTLPFNMCESQLRGGIMIVKKWKYPRPLCRQIKLTKVADKNTERLYE